METPSFKEDHISQIPALQFFAEFKINNVSL